MLASILYGVGLGAVSGGIAYVLFRWYMFNSTPVFPILAATPFAVLISWLCMPFYAALTYRWSVIAKGFGPSP